jgi:hypothetical protein
MERESYDKPTNDEKIPHYKLSGQTTNNERIFISAVMGKSGTGTIYTARSRDATDSGFRLQSDDMKILGLH